MAVRRRHCTGAPKRKPCPGAPKRSTCNPVDDCVNCAAGTRPAIINVTTADIPDCILFSYPRSTASAYSDYSIKVEGNWNDAFALPNSPFAAPGTVFYEPCLWVKNITDHLTRVTWYPTADGTGSGFDVTDQFTISGFTIFLFRVGATKYDLALQAGARFIRDTAGYTIGVGNQTVYAARLDTGTSDCSVLGDFGDYDDTLAGRYNDHPAFHHVCGTGDSSGGSATATACGCDPTAPASVTLNHGLTGCPADPEAMQIDVPAGTATGPCGASIEYDAQTISLGYTPTCKWTGLITATDTTEYPVSLEITGGRWKIVVSAVPCVPGPGDTDITLAEGPVDGTPITILGASWSNGFGVSGTTAHPCCGYKDLFVDGDGTIWRSKNCVDDGGELEYRLDATHDPDGLVAADGRFCAGGTVLTELVLERHVPGNTDPSGDTIPDGDCGMRLVGRDGGTLKWWGVHTGSVSPLAALARVDGACSGPSSITAAA